MHSATLVKVLEEAGGSLELSETARRFQRKLGDGHPAFLAIDPALIAQVIRTRYEEEVVINLETNIVTLR